LVRWSTRQSRSLAPPENQDRSSQQRRDAGEPDQYDRVLQIRDDLVHLAVVCAAAVFVVALVAFMAVAFCRLVRTVVRVRAVFGCVAIVVARVVVLTLVCTVPIAVRRSRWVAVSIALWRLHLTGRCRRELHHG